MTTIKEWKDWLTAWEELQFKSEVVIEQANLVMPAIKKKIEELELLEKQNGE